MSRIARAAEIAEQVAEALTAAGLEATVTINPLEIPAALANGPVVAIQPPDLKFTTYTLEEAEWELYVIAGPYADRLAAWGFIDPIITALVEPLNIDTAKAANFAHPSMPEYPAYVLAFTE